MYLYVCDVIFMFTMYTYNLEPTRFQRSPGGHFVRHGRAAARVVAAHHAGHLYHPHRLHHLHWGHWAKGGLKERRFFLTDETGGKNMEQTR